MPSGQSPTLPTTYKKSQYKFRRVRKSFHTYIHKQEQYIHDKFKLKKTYLLFVLFTLWIWLFSQTWKK
jgi:hypothetical protein